MLMGGRGSEDLRLGSWGLGAPGISMILLLGGVSGPLRQGDAARPIQFPGSYSLIKEVRDLGGGRVLVLDGRDQTLMLASLDPARVDTIGRRGRGPREFADVGALLQLRGDTTLVVDRGNSRMSTFSGGRLVATHAQAFVGWRASDVVLGGAPNAILVQRRASRHATGAGEVRDSVVFLLLHSSGSADTVGFGNGDRVVRRPISPNGPEATLMVVLDDPDQATVFPDGWVAIARTSPFTVTWHSPSGVVRRGPQLAWNAARVDETEKRAYTERLERLRGTRLPAFMPWASAVPPFTGERSLIPLANGNLLLRTTPRAGSPGSRYLIVNREGGAVASLVLAWNQRVVGCGAKFLFISEVSEEGLERLSARPLNSLVSR